MAKALSREKPFSGEVVRLYEEDKNRPGPQARRALAKVFEKDEAYIEFGESRPAVRQEQAHYDISDDARARDAKEEILLLLYRGLFSLQQTKLLQNLRAAFDANQITRKELGQKPLRGVSDQQVREAFGDAPFHRLKRNGKKKPSKRDLGDAMGDFLEDA